MKLSHVGGFEFSLYRVKIKEKTPVPEGNSVNGGTFCVLLEKSKGNDLQMFPFWINC